MRRMPVPIYNPNINYSFKLVEFIGKSKEYIENTKSNIICVNYKSLIDNFSLLKYLLTVKNFSIVCEDYESALFLENNLDENIKIKLLDDYENKDRNYINTNYFQKTTFSFPFSYCMWNPNINSEANVDFYRNNFNLICDMNTANATNKISKDFLLKTKEIIEKLNKENLSDIEKIIIVSNYLQSKVQYVEGIRSNADKIYEIQTNEVLKSDDLTQTVIEENYGTCGAITGATTLLLNNPTFNINTRNMFGSGHFWNLVILKDKNYFMDNTWAITRNPNRVEGALKAKNFSQEYLLFGSKKADIIRNHNTSCYIPGIISMDDFNAKELNNIKKKLSTKTQIGNYSNELRFKSKSL